MDMKKAIELAKQARSYACAVEFTVGACLITTSGKYYSGCNIENDGIQSICAERTAFVKALSEGERDFDAIVVLGAPKNSNHYDECFPCGYCRQFMSQYTKHGFKIYLYHGESNIKEYTISDLLPHSFAL